MRPEMGTTAVRSMYQDGGGRAQIAQLKDYE